MRSVIYPLFTCKRHVAKCHDGSHTGSCDIAETLELTCKRLLCNGAVTVCQAPPMGFLEDQMERGWWAGSDAGTLSLEVASCLSLESAFWLIIT